MTINLAFFGAGEQARPYLDVLARRPDVRIAGVCDRNRRAAEQIAAGWGATVHADCPTMLSEACPDALWVCVPPAQQGDVLLLAAEKRVPFFVDPPGAVSLAQAVEVSRLVTEGRVVTSVGWTTPYTDVAREGREYLGANVVPLAMGWWQRPTRDAGGTSAADLLWNEACVHVEALRWFCGEVDRVHAFPAGNAVPIEAAGGMVVHLRFRRGTSAVLTLATFPRPEPRVDLELAGEGWSLSFSEELKTLRVSEQDRTTILRRFNLPIEEQVKVFLDSVAAGDPSQVPTSYPDVPATLRVCNAAVVSAREGRAVDLVP